MTKGSRGLQLEAPLPLYLLFLILQGRNSLHSAFPLFWVSASVTLRLLHILPLSPLSLGYKKPPLSVLFALSPSDHACYHILCSKSIFLCPWFCFPALVYAFQLNSLVLQFLIAQSRSGLFFFPSDSRFSLLKPPSLAVLSQLLMT